MKRNTNTAKIRITALLMAMLCLVFLIPQGVVVPASAVTQAEIDALKENSKTLDQRRKELQAELAEISKDKSAAMQQKQIIDAEINVIQTKINNISDQIAKYETLIVQKQEEILEAEAEEAAQYELFCERVRYMEEDGQVSYWAILFNSADFSDLLDRFIMVDEIMEYDNSVMNNLIAIREAITLEKQSLELAKQEQESAKAEQESVKAELKSRQAEVDALIATIKTQEAQLEAAENELRQAARAMDAEITRKEQQLAAMLASQGKPIVSESGFIWPISSSVNNYNVLTSLYGGRTHPITGRSDNHTGIDIAVAGGTPILAAKSGVVLTAEYHYSYGNYVVISHSNGQSTLYAHMRSAAIVNVGDTVSQGQTVGYVGTTGSSTGNHLHYEVRVNGKRTDPVDYYSTMGLYVRYNGSLSPLN